eukprot:2027324-Alexandrium_andersonii.AAC.1
MLSRSHRSARAQALPFLCTLQALVFLCARDGGSTQAWNAEMETAHKRCKVEQLVALIFWLKLSCGGKGNGSHTLSVHSP